MKLIFSFCLIIFLPSFIYVVFKTPSMAYGMFIGSVLIMIGSRFKISKVFLNSVFIVLFVLFFLSQLFNLFVKDYSLKSLVSTVALIIIVFSASSFNFLIEKITKYRFIFEMKILSIIILFLGIVSIFYKPSFLGYESYAKAVFPFSEPSHFVISISPIIFFYGFYLKKSGKIFLLFLLSLLGLLHPSLTLLVLVILMICLYFIQNPIQFVLYLLTSGVIIYFVLLKIDTISYFSDRLNFSNNSSNLTALVYMQGWEDAFNSLIDTKGFGLGFQNMGSSKPGVYGEMIYSIIGDYKMREDGGFLASKIVSEFGLFGFSLIFYYIKLFINSFRLLLNNIKVNSDLSKKSEFTPHLVFAHCAVVSFSLEVFIRGYGYFSPGFFLFLSGVFLIYNNKTNLYESLQQD